MSTNLVGTGLFKNYDATETRAGVGGSGTAYTSRPDRMEEERLERDAGVDADGEGMIDPTSPNTTQETIFSEPQGKGPFVSQYRRDSNEYSKAQQVGESDEAREARFNKEVTNLARTMSRQSEGMDHSEKNPFEVQVDSELDAHSPNFKPRMWIKSLLHLSERDPETPQTRTAGFSFKNLNVHGFGSASDYQKTVGNMGLSIFEGVKGLLGLEKKRRIDILSGLDGVLYPGEMLVVLGPPGSGCSTFLKSVAGETHGFFVDESSDINYQGIAPKMMHKQFRGEAIYTAEVDVHFPNMTVGQTLGFAAQARAPRTIPGGIPRKQYAMYLRDATMAVFGISHTINTKVGNDYIRGVSGGERKRVTIAEAALSGAPLQCWDNSTRGLDSANAVEFVKTLRMSAELVGTTACVAIYQAPQAAYDVFNKALVLYEGRQIYFGPTTAAKQYFVDLGFWCPDRQTDADFLTSMTSPQERVVREGFEGRVPRTPDDFAAAWKASAHYKSVLAEIEAFNTEYPIGGPSLESFKASRKQQQSKHQRLGSPYTLSYAGQVKLCLDRGFQRLIADPSLTLFQIFANTIMALIVSSVFYNLKSDTGSFFSRGALLFFAILLNAFGSALEILTLYAQRPIVEKHTRYAFYHASAEAVASMLTDMPYKILNSITFNLVIYFMANLRRTPGHFFFFYLVSFLTLLAMSMLFRSIASLSRSLSEALTPAALLILGLVIYTGFAIPVPYMPGWSRWMHYIDLVGYAFESLMINEFWNRDFACSSFIPSGAGYAGVDIVNQICTAPSSVAGQRFVNGGAYISSVYHYSHGHKWRNVGILIVFIVGLCAVYIAASELISAKKSKGEVLLFRRGHAPASLTKETPEDEEAGTRKAAGGNMELSRSMSAAIAKQTAIFSWQDVTYDIKIKKEDRRILDHVDGWVKPGTLTALMGVSGAGKTTLLDVLATRVTMGVVSGDMLVDGRPRDASFQRKTGYVQQQDLHLETTTVREALNFSALLRQPAHIPRAEKLAYVDDVIKLLDMQEYADAVVGVPGEGLNVEQRKRLTIGVELAAKPQLLLFLDEPTSGLDSQTSWAICDLMEKLTKNGQAILCTIHQPSAMLFQRFDRLLFLAKGGRTVYFGPVGENSKILTSYFERNGAFPCPKEANPAEWMLEVIGAAPGSHSEIDWHQTWKDSPERVEVRRELAEIKEERSQLAPATDENDKAAYREFAAPFRVQMWEVQKRVFAQYWRTPIYIYSKLALCTLASLYIGFSFFNAGTSQQGLQNQLFAIFSLFTIFGQLIQQILPHFVVQRALYEVRERPSKTYSWQAFMLSNLFVELPWNALAGLIIFFCWYYPIGLYKNAIPSGEVHQRGGLMFLLVEEFLLFTSTFATMIIAAIDTAENAGNLGNLLFSLSLIFCGVLAAPGVFPHFWIFMYRVSPFTYLTDAFLSVGLANTNVVCAANELLHFTAPTGETCGTYMADYIAASGGYLQDPNATDCSFCTIKSTNTFLASVSSHYANRWRNFGILWAYIVFNGCMAVFLYWVGRVPKNGGKREKKEKKEK